MANVTGRDGWIIGQALATALVVLEQLPIERQPQSDMDDMRQLLAQGDAHAERSPPKTAIR